MLRGKIQMGTPQQTHLCWDQDCLLDCLVEDQVWGWSICSSEVVHYECAKLADDALHYLIMTGLAIPRRERQHGLSLSLLSTAFVW